MVFYLRKTEQGSKLNLYSVKRDHMSMALLLGKMSKMEVETGVYYREIFFIGVNFKVEVFL